MFDLFKWLLDKHSTSSETYSKAEVDDKIQDLHEEIAEIPEFKTRVVEELPTEDISTSTIYLVQSKSDPNEYDEYLYVDNNWEKIGTRSGEAESINFDNNGTGLASTTVQDAIVEVNENIDFTINIDITQAAVGAQDERPYFTFDSEDDFEKAYSSTNVVVLRGVATGIDPAGQVGEDFKNYFYKVKGENGWLGVKYRTLDGLYEITLDAQAAYTDTFHVDEVPAVTPTAANVSFVASTVSGIASTTVQGAIDEVATRSDTISKLSSAGSPDTFNFTQAELKAIIDGKIKEIKVNLDVSHNTPIQSLYYNEEYAGNGTITFIGIRDGIQYSMSFSPSASPSGITTTLSKAPMALKIADSNTNTVYTLEVHNGVLTLVN